MTTDPKSLRTFVVTGPTSGIGYRSALELAAHGTVILVGRNRDKLRDVKRRIERGGGKALVVMCDMSDIASVRRAAAEIIGLNLPISGLLNNAGAFPGTHRKSAQGWDIAFATNHLGPFVFTQSLVPHLPDGANVIFICSGVEDPERKPAVAAGFRGGRYISAESSARGEWEPGGSKMAGADAYATSKQCNLATMLWFARETPRIHVNAVEPGFSPATALARDANVMVRMVMKYGLAPLAPFIKYWSTPKRAGRIIADVVLDQTGRSGIYFDEEGKPMLGSKKVTDPGFQDRVVYETIELIDSAAVGGAGLSNMTRKHRA